ncbi:MAG: radical SAM protein [Proteobacteria bacterium]|nr:radical SAM protein [Desulfobacula sp.]MBU4133157.1 radical SAM protein [Pseudomonadota bacterium]
MALNLCEIFYSLQGESTFTGLPCTFVRLSGCNLNCTWCDTVYARDESISMPIKKIIDQVKTFDCSLVEITGGEPLLQAQTPELISRLLALNFQVLLETNGSLSIRDIDPRCIRILDIKCPSSNEADAFLYENLNYLTEKDEIKFVIGSRQDYEFARAMLQENLPKRPAAGIHLSPVFGQVTPESLAAWILEDRLPARLSLQLHKIIWNPHQRGV